MKSNGVITIRFLISCTLDLGSCESEMMMSDEVQYSERLQTEGKHKHHRIRIHVSISLGEI